MRLVTGSYWPFRHFPKVPKELLVASLLLVAMPFVTSIDALAPSSFLLLGLGSLMPDLE